MALMNRLKFKVMQDCVRALEWSSIMLGMLQRSSPSRVREKTLSKAQISLL